MYQKSYLSSTSEESLQLCLQEPGRVTVAYFSPCIGAFHNLCIVSMDISCTEYLQEIH